MQWQPLERCAPNQKASQRPDALTIGTYPEANRFGDEGGVYQVEQVKEVQSGVAFATLPRLAILLSLRDNDGVVVTTICVILPFTLPLPRMTQVEGLPFTSGDGV